MAAMDKFRVTQKKRESYFEMESSHVHDFHEVYYLIGGTRRYFIDDSIYTINKGDVVVILKGTIHRTSYNNEKTHERMDCKFRTEFLNADPKLLTDFESAFSDSPVISLAPAQRDHLTHLLKSIRAEYENPDELSDINARALIQSLMVFLIRLKRLQQSPVGFDPDDSLMQEAARYIRTNYAAPLTLEGIAAHVNTSPTYFSKKFKRATGFGCREYLVNVRLQEATKMLLQTNMSITDIALTCGFNSSNYFGDVFRKANGVSPAVYRKNNKLS
ncbi:MAG: helix-turn-helix transcriptional regulator [Firmicutes bacterium]|nr:helix-turn-helix transcriptional regulator [Bacillota bacterium]